MPKVDDCTDDGFTGQRVHYQDVKVQWKSRLSLRDIGAFRIPQDKLRSMRCEGDGELHMVRPWPPPTMNIKMC